MICYVDIEHEKRLEDEEKRSFHLAERADIRRRLEEISGEPCMVQHYSRVTRQRLRDWGIRALIIGLNRTDWADYSETDLAEMYHIIRTAELPMIGLCGGCQLIALAHGAPLGPIRRLREGEDDPSTDYAPGCFKEWGFMPVRVVRSDPLFDGLGEGPVFHEEHYWEVKEIPLRFKVLASSGECRIQVIKHVEKLVYGTQFHPERYTEEQSDGRQLLINFFKLAGILEKGKSGGPSAAPFDSAQDKLRTGAGATSAKKIPSQMAWGVEPSGGKNRLKPRLRAVLATPKSIRRGTNVPQ